VGAKTTKGYGNFYLRHFGKTTITVRSHRLAWELSHWCFLAEKEVICHRCDNPPCNQPAHLFPGTHAENTADMLRKKREARGPTHGAHTQPQAFYARAKLTPALVKELRFLASTGIFHPTDLADYYQTHADHIRNIVYGRSWKHIEYRLTVKWAPTDNLQGARRPKGIENAHAKLTEDQVMTIRTRHAAGETMAALGKEFGVGYTNISQIVHRHTWKHI